jgi:hypothetical protein
VKNLVVPRTRQYKEVHSKFLGLVLIILADWTILGSAPYSPSIKCQVFWCIEGVLGWILD